MQPFRSLSNQRLPPSDLHVQQAQNSPRFMSVNLLPTCPRALKIGDIHDKENKSIKAQYPKNIERKHLIKDFEVNLSLSLITGWQFLGLLIP